MLNKIIMEGGRLEWQYGPDTRSAEITAIEVDPDRRLQGVGRALVSKLEEECCEVSTDIIYGVVRTDDAGAMDFWRDLGYIIGNQLLGKKPLAPFFKAL